jgi:hypothetical protein
MTTETAQEETLEPVAHAHEGEHEGDGEPDEGIQAYVTTITLAIAHGSAVTPQQMVAEVHGLLQQAGMKGVAHGVASVELRGDGGLIGL